MTQINPKKLLRSKWTSLKPQKKEKHFMVVDITFDEDQIEVLECVIEAVITKRAMRIDWRQLKDDSLWKQGWN